MIDMNLVTELHAIASALTAAKIPYAVCGGIAVTAHGAPRFTKDIDILIARVDVAAALEAVRPLGYAFAALPMAFGQGTSCVRHVQRVSKIDGQEHLVLDLLLAEEGYAGMLDDRIQIALPEGPLWVVSRETLIRMKRQAGRPLDLADIERLETGSE